MATRLRLDWSQQKILPRCNELSGMLSQPCLPQVLVQDSRISCWHSHSEEEQCQMECPGCRASQ